MRQRSPWGIMAAGARQCVIRNCAAFLNGGGIGMFSSRDGEGYNLIEKCRAYANYSKHSQEGGNICGFQSFHDEIRDCYAYPQFRITAGKEPTDREGKKIEFLADWLAGQRDLDFPDLFATHPDLVKRGIGLQAGAFRDFHFTRPEHP